MSELASAHMPDSFEVDGIRGDVSGAGKHLLLLHGLSSSRRTWDLLMPYLTAQFTVVRLDLPGHGASRERRTSDSLDAIAKQVLLVLESRQLELAGVVGHSWGASVALHLATYAPHLIPSLVLLDGGYMDFRSMPGVTWESISRDLAPPHIDTSPRDFSAMIQEMFGPGWSQQVTDIFLGHMHVVNGRVRARLPFDDHMAYLRGMWDDDLPAQYALLKTPTLLVLADLPGPGSVDWRFLRDRAIRVMQSSIDDLRIESMPVTMHDMHIQRPLEVAGLITNFVDGGVPVIP